MGMVTGAFNVVEGNGLAEAGSATQAPSSDANSSQPSGEGSQAALPPIVNGKQVLKMEASASGYSPDHLKVRVSVPVSWQIKNTGASGCTGAIKADTLFTGQVQLTPEQTTVQEFTPKKIGRFRFSCWMGMINGYIDVVDPNNPNQTKFDYDETTFPSSGGCCG